MNDGRFQYPIVGTGSALPRRCLTNADLVALLGARGVETSDEWIVTRTGITQRYWCGDGESVVTLAEAAAAQALARAGVDPAAAGVLVVATCTPNENFPSVAAQVHGRLGFGADCLALDINAACSGFVHGLAVAKGLLETLLLPTERRVAVVIGAEAFSGILNLDDRSTAVLFGDGAGAVVVQQEPAAAVERGLLAISGGTAGTLGPALATVQRQITMEGREVFKHAVRQMGGSTGAVDALLARVGLGRGDIDLVVPHQANVRILEAAATALGLAPAQVVVTVDRHANTSAASIPLALDVAVQDGRVRAGDIVLLQAFGAGFTWSEAVLRW